MYLPIPATIIAAGVSKPQVAQLEDIDSNEHELTAVIIPPLLHFTIWADTKEKQVKLKS